MDIIEDYFLCDECKNKDFIRIYKFSVQFRSVNFSEDLIHDQVTNAIYQCTHCKKTFSKHQVEEGLKSITDERLESLPLPKKQG